MTQAVFTATIELAHAHHAQSIIVVPTFQPEEQGERDTRKDGVNHDIQVSLNNFRIRPLEMDLFEYSSVTSSNSDEQAAFLSD